MRVLLIDVNCKYSSTGKIVYSLYKAIREKGDQAAICFGRGEIVKEEDIYRFAPQWEVYTHALLTRITGRTGCFSPIATRNLLRYLDDYKPDVVHIHELHAYFVNLKPIVDYLKENHIKTIWTFHCEFMYTGKCGYAYECEKWKTGCNHCPRLKEYPASFGIDQTARMWEEKKKLMENWPELTIVTPSEWLKKRVMLSFCKESPIQVIHNGVDRSVFYPRASEALRKRLAPNGEKIVLSVAPDIMSSIKGGRWVLSIAERLKDDPIQFVLVGANADDVKRYSAIPNVKMIERTNNQDELAQYYSLADVFVLCSKYETFSMTCAEALCCGTPVYGFKCGAPETTFMEPYARFVEYGNLKALILAVCDALEASYDREAIAEYARKEFSEGSMYQNYLKAYDGT